MMQSEDGTIDLAAPIDSAAHDRFLLQYLHNQCILDIVFEEHRCASVAARARDFFSPAQGLSRGAVQARVPLRRPAEQEAQARARGGARGAHNPVEESPPRRPRQDEQPARRHALPARAPPARVPSVPRSPGLTSRALRRRTARRPSRGGGAWRAASGRG